VYIVKVITVQFSRLFRGSAGTQSLDREHEIWWTTKLRKWARAGSQRIPEDVHWEGQERDEKNCYGRLRRCHI